jgi:hypothetical protein
MALKNTFSGKPINKIFSDLQKNLAVHGAKKIMFDYGNDGKIYGITFGIDLQGKMIGFKLPARLENVGQILKNENAKRFDEEQIYRVAWRNIEQWIESQCAMIDIGMVKIEEVFLPYMTDSKGKSLYEKFESNGFLLGDGKTN